MTIKELYEWAIKNGVEDYDLLNGESWMIIKESDLETDDSRKDVIV